MAARFETEPMKRSAIQQLPFGNRSITPTATWQGSCAITPASKALRYRFVTLWSELRTPWRAAFEEAWTAYRAGSLPMGAVVVDRDGGIVGRGRNRIFETAAELAESQCVFGHRLAHAEINALIGLNHATTNMRECSLYVTLESCVLCVGAIRMAGLKEVHYVAHDPIAGGLALLEATDFMRRGAVIPKELGHPVIAFATIALNVAAHLELVDNWKADRWQAAGLPGVEFGQQLFATGALRRLADRGTSIAEVLEHLANAYGPATGHRRVQPSDAPLVWDAAGQADRRAVVLIITGAPASGKTTIGRQVARALGLPYFSTDLFKEALFERLGWEDRDWSRRLGVASAELLYCAAAAELAAGRSVAVESNFSNELSTPEFRALQAKYDCRFVQLVCTAPGAILVERFERRARSGERHPGHTDAASLDELLPRLLTERWDALALDGAVFRVETGNGVDIDDLVSRIRWVGPA
jgi:tRNA(Arg) A34 adenosine deaminase TadA/predicted kinase